MRRLLLILMIALLPVRGWAADVMGVVMAAHELSATLRIAGGAGGAGSAGSADHLGSANEAKSVQPSGAETPFSMSPNCPMWAAQTAGDDTSTSYEGCATCQLCMALVVGQPFVLSTAASLPQAAQGFSSVTFTSAERAPGFKPPIS